MTYASKRRQQENRPEALAEVIEPRNPKDGKADAVVVAEGNIVKAAMGEAFATSPGSKSLACSTWMGCINLGDLACSPEAENGRQVITKQGSQMAGKKSDD